MKDFSIKSRKYGTVTFTRPGDRYVYVNINGEPGTLGNQICDGGRLSGSTIGIRGDGQSWFEYICRRWWRAYLKNQRDNYFD